jgi:hypothetical protein
MRIDLDERDSVGSVVVSSEEALPGGMDGMTGFVFVTEDGLSKLVTMSSPEIA